MVVVAALAAKAAGVLAGAAITATLRLARSARHSRQTIVSTFRPPVFVRDVLALDISGLAQPLKERTQTARGSVGRFAAEEPDHRHRPLLRTRTKRPCRSAAEQRDEGASLHSITLSASA